MCFASSACGGAASVWLAAGVVVSLGALAAGVAMMAVGGTMVAAALAVGVLAAPAGTARAWRRARRAALCRTAGDARCHVPGAGGPARLVLPQSRAQFGRRARVPSGRRRAGAPGRRHRGARRALPPHPGAAGRRGASAAGPCRRHRRAQPAAGRDDRRAVCGCGIRPAVAGRSHGRACGSGAGRHHRRAAHRRTGRADRAARGARVRRRGPHAGLGAGARGGDAGHAARACGPHRAGQCRRVPVRPDGDPRRPDRGRRRPGRRGGCGLPCGGGVRGGRRAAARRRSGRSRRRCRASRAGGRGCAGAGAGSAASGCVADRLRAPLRGGAFPLAGGSAAGVRRAHARRAARRPRCAAGTVRRRQVARSRRWR